MGLGTIKATKLTNKSNQQINQANIDYSWQALNTQNQFNIEQWNRENVYNDPSAQMQRYLNAGLNPWNSASSIDSGNADSLTSAQYSSPQLIPMQQPNQSAVGNVLDSIQTALDGSLKIMDILKGGSTFSDTIKGVNAVNQGYVLDTEFNRATNKNKIAATNQIYKAQEYTAANEAAYQLALSRYGMDEKAATTFSNWITSRETQRQNLQNLVDQHLLNEKSLDWFDKDHEASFEKQMASAGVDRQTIKRMKKELPFVEDYMRAQIDELNSRSESEHESAVDFRETRWSRNNQMNMNAFNFQQQGYYTGKQNQYFTPDFKQRAWYDGYINPKSPWYEKYPARFILGLSDVMDLFTPFVKHK